MKRILFLALTTFFLGGLLPAPTVFAFDPSEIPGLDKSPTIMSVQPGPRHPGLLPRRLQR